MNFKTLTNDKPDFSTDPWYLSEFVEIMARIMDPKNIKETATRNSFFCVWNEIMLWLLDNQSAIYQVNIYLLVILSIYI